MMALWQSRQMRRRVTQSAHSVFSSFVLARGDSSLVRNHRPSIWASRGSLSSFQVFHSCAQDFTTIGYHQVRSHSTIIPKDEESSGVPHPPPAKPAVEVKQPSQEFKVLFVDYYQLLGIEETATKEQIIEAFNKAGAEACNSSQQDDDDKSPEVAEEKLARLQRALDTLLDRESRLEHDAKRRLLKEILLRRQSDPAWLIKKQEAIHKGKGFWRKTKFVWPVFIAAVSLLIYLGRELSKQKEMHKEQNELKRKAQEVVERPPQ